MKLISDYQRGAAYDEAVEEDGEVRTEPAGRPVGHFRELVRAEPGGLRQPVHR